MFIYLDNQTLTQPLPDLLPFFKQSLEDYWENIMSPCEINKGTKKVFQENYAAFYALLGLQDSDTFILSSSTSEITNHLILSTYLDRVRQDGRNGFITSEIEEAPALLGIERLFPLGCQGKMLKVDKHGLVCLDDLTKQLSSRTTFMALSLANGLTGVIQPLEPLAEICRDKSIHLHVDI